MGRTEEALLTFLILCWSAIYHPLVFIVTMFTSAALARLVASVVFDRFYFPGISRYYFDVLLMLTVFPYILGDGVIYVERLFLKLPAVKCRIERVLKASGHRVVETCLTAYVLGTSYGLVISKFNERLEAPLYETAALPSPLRAMIAVWNITVRGYWDGIGGQGTGRLLHFEYASCLETFFVLSCFVPVYCTVRCFNKSSKYNSDSGKESNMRLHFLYFISSAACCCRRSIWDSRRCCEYLAAFIYEIAMSFYFVVLPLFLTFILTKDTEQPPIYSLSKILFAILMSGVLLSTERVLSPPLQAFLQKNVQARYMATVCLLYLTSFPLFIMYFMEENSLPSNSFWCLRHQCQLQLFITFVAFSAHGCTKLSMRNLLSTLSWHWQPLTTELPIISEKLSGHEGAKEYNLNMGGKSKAVIFVHCSAGEVLDDEELLLP